MGHIVGTETDRMRGSIVREGAASVIAAQGYKIDLDAYMRVDWSKEVHTQMEKKVRWSDSLSGYIDWK